MESDVFPDKREPKSIFQNVMSLTDKWLNFSLLQSVWAVCGDMNSSQRNTKRLNYQHCTAIISSTYDSQNFKSHLLSLSSLASKWEKGAKNVASQCHISTMLCWDFESECTLITWRVFTSLQQLSSFICSFLRDTLLLQQSCCANR